jgi:hypothetical protein
LVVTQFNDREEHIMIIKTIIAAAAVSAIAFGASAPANAKVNVDLYFGGFGPGYYEPAYPVYEEPRYVEPRYAEPRHGHHRPRYEYSGISCDDGSQAVRDIGFRKVRAIDCSGQRYTYKARRHGDNFIVKVSSRNGNVISVQQAW